MAEQSFWSQTPIRVRYAETDQMGIVYYANYLVWFEMGRTDFCRKVGFTYKDMEQTDGLFIAVAEVKCRYHAPSTYDENLLLRTCLKACRTRLLVFGYEIYRQDGSELITTGETVHIVTNRLGRPDSLPEKYYALLSNAVLKDGGKSRRTVLKDESSSALSAPI